MENTSKSNLEYQFEVIFHALQFEVADMQSIEDFDYSSLNEKIEGIKEIKFALKTLTN